MIHKTKKEEGKKHKTKKKTQKKQQIFRIKLRKDRFRMFGHHSKLISAVLAWFKADFGLFQPFRSPADTAWFWPNLLGSAWIEAELAWIESSCCESEEKKKKKAHTQLQRAGSRVGRRTPCQAAADSGAAPSQLRPCFIDTYLPNNCREEMGTVAVRMNIETMEWNLFSWFVFSSDELWSFSISLSSLLDVF